MAPDILGLIVGPLIGDLVLQDNFFGMGAMAEQRDGGHQHGQHRHGEGDGGEVGMLTCVFGMLVQFVEFFGHFVGLREFSVPSSQ